MAASLGPLAILGCGAVGTALARALGAKGHELWLWSRDPVRSRRAARQARRAGAQAVRSVARPAQAVSEARVVLLCLPEASLRHLARELCAAAPVPRGRSRPCFVTVSGVAALGPLARWFRSCGALGRMHPLGPVLPGDSAQVFEGLAFGLEGPPAVLRRTRALVRSLGGFPLRLSGRAPERYHAGAALLGGGLVALLELAEETMADSVRSRRALRAALLAFAVQNARNVARRGAVAALTGPIARGARENVLSNLRALRGTPRGRATYRLLGATLLELAARKPSAERDKLDALRGLLRP